MKIIVESKKLEGYMIRVKSRTSLINKTSYIEQDLNYSIKELNILVAKLQLEDTLTLKQKVKYIILYLNTNKSKNKQYKLVGVYMRYTGMFVEKE